MKPTKIRNYQIFRATLGTRSKQLGSPLSKELRQKYGKRSIRIVLGDTVKVIRGEYRGVDGKVSKISTQTNSVGIEGVKKEKSKGEKFDVLIHSTNVMVTGLNLNDHWRKTKLEGKKPKTTPKETKIVESKAEEPRKEPLKKDKLKKETKSTKKSEKSKRVYHKNEKKSKPAIKKKEDEN